jgi:hypothetical protein
MALDPFELSNTDHVSFDNALLVFSDRMYASAGVRVRQVYSYLPNSPFLTGKMPATAPEILTAPPSGPDLIACDFSTVDRLKDYNPRTVYLLLDRPLAAPDAASVKVAFKRYYLSVLVHQRTKSRDLAIGQCLRAAEPSSLAKQMRKVTRLLTSAEGVSVFLIDRSGSYLQLQSATALRHDVRVGQRVWANNLSPQAHLVVPLAYSVLQSGKPIFLQEFDPQLERATTAPEQNYKLHNQCFLPIRLQQRNSKTANVNDVFGVIRVSNVTDGGEGDAKHYRSLSWEDCFLLDFLMEALYLYLHGVRGVEKSRRRFDRATHAIDLAADASLYMARSIKSELFSEADGRLIPLGVQTSQLSRDREVRLWTYMLSLDAYLEDLNEQILLNTGLENQLSGTFKQDAIIRNFVDETLRPLARMAPRVALLHDGKKAPVLSRVDSAIEEALEASGWRHVPPVFGRAKHLQSVFRNLLDNSIKYSPRPTASIDISIRFDSKFADSKQRNWRPF